jgi:hypothetical protein
MKKLIRKKIQEGESTWDSISAFGRQAADTATFGGYKYARAGADYAAKNIASMAGYGKGTTYDKELDQEKEKLAHDDAEHQQASSAGRLAGATAVVAAPEIPVVGATIGSAISAGDKASKIPYYLGLAKKAIGLEEEMTAGSGQIAGIGIGPQGEPGRPAQMMPMVKRAKRGKLGQWDTFQVSSDRFHKIKEEKRKGAQWRKYLEEDDYYHDIREYANHPKNRKKPIIIQDERTGAMTFARYGKER